MIELIHFSFPLSTPKQASSVPRQPAVGQPLSINSTSPNFMNTAANHANYANHIKPGDYENYGTQGLARVHCVFQTRKGGFSKPPFNDGNIAYTVNDDQTAILTNRKALLGQLNQLKMSAWAEENQVHGDNMVLDAHPTDLASKGQYDADGLTTSQSGLGLMIKTADCQPILLAHSSGKYVAALHVGWRGNRINFIAKAVKQFCEHYHVQPDQLVAVRGPSLSPAKAEFLNFELEWGNDFLPWFNQRAQTMNLWQLTQHQLAQAGLLEGNIYGIDLCTFSQSELFFSYRRDKNFSGRQASFIWIE